MAEMKKWTYPLHFIDFETYLGAVPLFKGNRPNEEIAYQFSHHIGYEDGTWKHAGDFIKLEPGKFPNFDFVRELKKQLEKDDGTIFRYASHENSILNAIREQLIESSESDKDDLVRYIESITHLVGGCKLQRMVTLSLPILMIPMSGMPTSKSTKVESASWITYCCRQGALISYTRKRFAGLRSNTAN